MSDWSTERDESNAGVDPRGAGLGRRVAFGPFTGPVRRGLVVLAVLLWLGTAYAPVIGAAFHGHDLELLVRAGQWSEADGEFGPRAIGDFAPIEVLNVVGDDARGDVGSLLSGLWMVLSLRLWGAVDGRALGLPSPFFFRIENLALLLIASWGLWRFLNRLFRPWVGAVQAERAGFAAASMFAVHPLCIPTVANLAGRSDLMSLAFATWAAVAFLTGRQERQYALLVIAGVLCFLAALSGQIALALPPALALAEFLSSGRQRPLGKRARTGINTLVVYSLCVQLNVLMVSTTTGHGYYPEVSYSLAGLLEPGAIVEALGNVLGKVGVLCLPANATTLGALGAVLALVLFLAALQPAMVAARSAPRLWTAAFVWWALATSFALLFGLRRPVDLVTMGDATSLVPATLVLCSGLGLACTAVSGLRRFALPLALSFGYASLANGNAQPWRAAAGAFAQLRADVVRALEEHPGAEQIVVVDAPRAVLGVDGIEDGLRWMAHPMFTGAAVEAPGDLEPLDVRDLPREAFATWVRSRGFDQALAGRLLLLTPDPEVDRQRHLGRLFVRADGGPPRLFWSDHSRSPDLDLDALGPAVLEVVLPSGDPQPLPETVHWRAFQPESSEGQVQVLWLDGEDPVRGIADAGESLAWRLAGRVARVFFAEGLTGLGEARIVETLPRPVVGQPELVGSSWRFGAPSSPILAELPGGQWRLRALATASLEFRAGTTRSGRSGSPLRFDGLGRWASVRLAAGESIAWELDYRVEDKPILRAAGTLELPTLDD